MDLDEFAEEAGRSLLRQQNARLRSDLKAAQSALDDALGRLAVLEGIDRLDPKPPKWTSPKKPGPRQAVMVAMLSDTHFDEIVRAEDVAGVNAYDRRIASTRLRSWVDGVIVAADHGTPASSIAQAMNVVNIASSPCAKFNSPEARKMTTIASARMA